MPLANPVFVFQLHENATIHRSISDIAEEAAELMKKNNNFAYAVTGGNRAFSDLVAPFKHDNFKRLNDRSSLALSYGRAYGSYNATLVFKNKEGRTVAITYAKNHEVSTGKRILDTIFQVIGDLILLPLTLFNLAKLAITALTTKKQRAEVASDVNAFNAHMENAELLKKYGAVTEATLEVADQYVAGAELRTAIKDQPELGEEALVNINNADRRRSIKDALTLAREHRADPRAFRNITPEGRTADRRERAEAKAVLRSLTEGPVKHQHASQAAKMKADQGEERRAKKTRKILARKPKGARR